MYKQVTKQTLLVIMSLTLLLVLVGSTSVWAQGDDTKQAEANINHTPKVPVIVDGNTRYEPDEFYKNFKEREMHYLVDKKALEEGILYAFTTNEGLEAYLAKTDKQLQQQFQQQSVFMSSSLAFAYANTNYSGVSDTLGLSGGCPTPFFYQNNAESLKNQTSYRAKLYDYSWCGGSTLDVTAGLSLSNLGVYGWANRADNGKLY